MGDGNDMHKACEGVRAEIRWDKRRGCGWSWRASERAGQRMYRRELYAARHAQTLLCLRRRIKVTSTVSSLLLTHNYRQQPNIARTLHPHLHLLPIFTALFSPPRAHPTSNPHTHTQPHHGQAQEVGPRRRRRQEGPRAPRQDVQVPLLLHARRSHLQDVSVARWG